MSEYGIKFARGFSLHEALHMLEEDDFPHPTADIILLPPDDGAQTDEDSGDEDAVTLDNFPSTQLGAPAEVQVPLEDSDSEDDNIPLARLISKKSKSAKKTMKNHNWTKTHILYESKAFSSNQENELENEGDSPVSYFHKFFDENVFDLLIEETNRYATAQNYNRKRVTITEMKSFIGILILSGYVPYPRRRLFWEKDKDVHNLLVSGALSRDRFDYIMSVFHMADNNNFHFAEPKFSKTCSTY